MTKQFQIEVANVGAPVFTQTTRGGYNTIEVAYKDGGKITGKKFIDIYAREVYSVLAAAKPGDCFSVTSEKDAKGYYQWLSISPVDKVATKETGSPSAGPSNSAGVSQETTGQVAGRGTSGRVAGSNYETPEERAVRQAAIVRQAVLNAAIEYVKLSSNPETNEVEVDYVLGVAKRFEEFVYDGISAKAEEYRKQVKSL